jgi:hypothetical protein
MTERPADFDPAAVAARLLDAHVDYVLAELGEDRFAEAAARVVADVFEVGGALTVGDVIDPVEVTNTALVLVDQLGDNAVVDNLALEFAEAIHQLPAADEHTLAHVVPREVVSRLIAKLLSMRDLQDRAMDRLAESPVVATVAGSFVTKIIDSFAQGNRARVEKTVPGLGQVFAVGDLISDAVRGSAVGKAIDDATSGVTQFALQHTTAAVRELIDEAPLHDAAMQMWDLRSGEPLGGTKEYLDKGDIRDLVKIGIDLVTHARDTAYMSAVVQELVRVFFANYGRHTIAGLITELGFEPDELVNELITHVQPVLAAANREGLLAERIRAQLAPFYESDAVGSILSGD